MRGNKTIHVERSGGGGFLYDTDLDLICDPSANADYAEDHNNETYDCKSLDQIQVHCKIREALQHLSASFWIKDFETQKNT